MSLFFDRVAFLTETTGTGTVEIDEAITPSFFTPDEAGVTDGATPIPYLILDGQDVEYGYGTYNTGTPATFSRDTVIKSKIAGTVGTSKIDLSGNARVRFTLTSAELSAFSTFDGAYSSLSGIPSTFTPAAHSHTLSDISDAGTAAAADTEDFATADQGSKADTAVQPDALGDAASLDVGTSAGTVAAGDDNRFTQSAISTKTTNYTFALADAGTTVYMNSSSTRTLTVPPNSSVAFPTGTYINFGRLGTGSVTLTPGSGVTIRNANGLVLASQYSIGTLHKIGTDEWIAGGDLTT